METTARTLLLMCIFPYLAFSQTTLNEPQNKMIVHADSGKSMISRHINKNIPLECELRGIKATRVSGKMLTVAKLNSYNTFNQPDNVKITIFNKAALNGNMLKVEMPARSVVVLNVN